MATVLVSGLTASVVYTENKTEGPNGVRKPLTECRIMAGTTVVASKTIAGRWSQMQALKEFKRLPKGWTVHEVDLARLPIAA